MKYTHNLIAGLLFALSSTAFATNQVKYETHYTIEKSSQVEHLKIAQITPNNAVAENT